MDIEKYRKGRQVAVLYSPRYGAGWTSWNETYKTFLAMDKGLVELVLNEASREEVDKYIKDKLGPDSYVYTGGWRDIAIEWLTEGTAFRITEYDGYEQIELGGEVDWMVT
jgi:hypothetical protein